MIPNFAYFGKVLPKTYLLIVPDIYKETTSLPVNADSREFVAGDHNLINNIVRVLGSITLPALYYIIKPSYLIASIYSAGFLTDVEHIYNKENT